jgi:hypothetical protein
MGAELTSRGPEDRRALLAFVKSQHPDAGGDVEAFLAGLRHWQRGPARQSETPINVVLFHRRRRGAAVVTGWWPRRRTRRPRVH